ncbi:MAG: alpha/beta fold hydrolase, partial [Saprospiraceae bacterium]
MKLNHKIIGTGKPVIIMHGLFGMLDNWRSIAKMLEEDFQCILVDLRNHGKSPHTDEMNYEIMVNDVIELMDDLHLSNAILLGHSMGGKVAMHLALKYPEKAEKLIVVDIAPKKYTPHHEDVIAAIQAIDPCTLEDRSEAEQIFTQHLGTDQATIQFLLKNLSRKAEGGFEWKANMDSLIEHYSDLLVEVG